MLSSFRSLWLGVLLVISTGCGQSESPQEQATADQDLLTDLLGDIDLTEAPPQNAEPVGASAAAPDSPAGLAEAAPAEFNPQTAMAGSPSDINVATVSSSFSAPPVGVHAGTPLPGSTPGSNSAPLDLSLQWNFGDQFSLIKTVQQSLTQQSAATPVVATTSLELHMDLQVQQLRDDASLLRITYRRVRYEHNVNGDQQTFDSSVNDPRTVAPGLALYAGLVNNGFSFWLGHDNTVRELVGYNAFLQRCVAALPMPQQAAVLSGISDRFGTAGVAGFVDDSIGILPGNSSTQSAQVTIGDIWTRERSVAMPVPVQIKSTYRLESVAARSATIQVTETLTPTTAVPGSPVSIEGGRSMGTCVVDRATGMPLDVGRTTFVSLRVRTADGQSVAQEKRIVTRVQSTSATRAGSGGPAATMGPTVGTGQWNTPTTMSGSGIRQAAGWDTMPPRKTAAGQPPHGTTPIPTTLNTAAPNTAAPNPGSPIPGSPIPGPPNTSALNPTGPNLPGPETFNGAPLSSTTTAVY